MMKIFITGGTGLIGSSLIPQLVSSGHTITCLTRSSASATKATSLGATPLTGTLLDLTLLTRASADADAVIHLAFDHDNFDDFPAACQLDRDAIQAMLAGIKGTDKPFICASGTLLTAGETEECRKIPIEALPRWKSEEMILEACEHQGLVGMIVRLPPVVHGPITIHPFLKGQIAGAVSSNEAIYIGEGNQRWPSAQVDDVAKVFAVLLDKGEGGKIYHAIDENGVKVRDIAQAIAEKLGKEVKSVSKEEAVERLGFVGNLMDMDNHTQNALTLERLEGSWKPIGKSLLEEMKGYDF